MSKRASVKFASGLFVQLLLLSCFAPPPEARTAGVEPVVSTANTGGHKTDRRVYPEPPLPRLPAAGGKFTDPTFNTQIMRVTDERDGTNNGTFYPHWPTFNCNNTRLLVRRSNGDSIYRFDPVSFTLGSSFTVPHLPTGGSLITEGAIWSATDPNILYGGAWNGPRLWALNVSTKSYTLIRDFSDELDASDILWQMSMSEDADVFAFTRKNKAEKVLGYVVYRHSTKKVLYVADTSLNEVRLDKTGRFLTIPLNEVDAKGKSFLIHDLQTGSVAGLVDGKPDFSPAHGDVGKHMLIAWDRWNNRLLYRDLASPYQFRSVLDLGSDWTMNIHVSLLEANDDWALVTFFSYNSSPPAGLFHDELVLVKTDGSQSVKRIAHHRAVAKQYWDQPKATISRDGQYVAFTSNWGGSGRNDLFIARVETGSAPTSTLMPTPTSTLPSNWENRDIGAVDQEGSAEFEAASGTFTLWGAGIDIWGSADGFHYVYRSLDGDGQIVARVTGLENTHRYAKAGVMIREGLTAGARHVIMDVTPGLSTEFMKRASAGGETVYVGGGMVRSPAWVKLVRSGNSFSGYMSEDGVNWRLAGRSAVEMASKVQIGLVVTSHSAALCAATFDHVKVIATTRTQTQTPGGVVSPGLVSAAQAAATTLAAVSRPASLNRMNGSRPE